MMAMSCGYNYPKLDDLPPQFTSCASLATSCGTAANEDCCQAAMVPGTAPGIPFHRDFDLAPDALNGMGFPATVSTFVLDRYEVTVGRFRAFVEARLGTHENPPAEGSGAHPKLMGSGWDSSWNADLVASTAALTSALTCTAGSETWTDAPGENENKPMNCVTW